MKLRFGFVSNSSSSSFVIKVKDITGKQLAEILTNDYTDQPFGDSWDIECNKCVVKGSVFMDNYSMRKFLDKIGVNPDVVEWGGY